MLAMEWYPIYPIIFYGERLYAHVRHAFDELTQGEEEVTSRRDLRTGLVRLGVSEIAMQGAVLSALQHFHERYAGIQVRVQSMTSPQAMAALHEGRINLAVITQHGDETQGITLRRFQDVIVVATDTYSGREIGLEALAEIPYIGMEEHTLSYPFFRDWFAARHMLLSPEIEVTSATQILQMVKAGLGFGILPDFMAEAEIRQGLVRKIETGDTIPMRRICLLQSPGNPLSLAAEAFQGVLQELADNMGDHAGEGAGQE